MSDPRRLDGERVFCHQCSNEWDRARGGLQCPRCEGEFVEILSGNSQPNADDFDLGEDEPHSPISSLFPRNPPLETRPRSNLVRPPSPHPLHNHDPWADVPDPDEGDISSFQFQTPGGRGTFSFTSRTYSSRNSPFANRAGGPQVFGFGPPPAGFGGFEARGGATWGQARGPQPPSMQDILSAIFSTVQPEHMTPQQHQRGGIFVNGNAAREANHFDLLSAILNPGAFQGRAGDVVFSQEAFDRILEQLAEQGNNAPPPASEAAIKALPKKKIDKEMLGDDGNAECSICMEAVEIGTEVTTLPCNHWFHEDCVVAWLKEHDTCPHCRKPITNDQQRQQQPMPPGSARRRSRRSSSVASPHGGNGTNVNPWPVPDSPSAVRDARNRYYGNRTTSDRDRGPSTPIRRSTSPVRSTEPQQYYGGTYESTDYYAGRPQPSQRRSSRSDSQSQRSQQGSQGGGSAGGVAGWIRDHLPMGGNGGGR